MALDFETKKKILKNMQFEWTDTAQHILMQNTAEWVGGELPEVDENESDEFMQKFCDKITKEFE